MAQSSSPPPSQSSRHAPAPADVPAVPLDLERIVLRLPTWVGDVVMAGPTVQAIREAAPRAELVAATRPGLEGLAALLPGIDRTVTVGRERGARGIRQAARAYAGLGAEGVVVFPRGTRAMLGPFLARIPVRVGFGGRVQRRLLTHPVEGWRPWRTAHRSRYFGVLAHAFRREIPPAVTLEPPPAARAEARHLLQALGRRPGRRLVLLEPGASYGAAKCWPVAHFGDLAAKLKAHGHDVGVVGTASSTPLEQEIEGRAGGRILGATGRTPDLRVLAAVLAEADLVVANDTGPMHVAAAVAAPLLALFGATDPGVSAPLGTGPRHLLWRPAPCSPCFLRTCVVEGHPCLGGIGVETVLEAAEALLATPQSRGGAGVGGAG